MIFDRGLISKLGLNPDEIFDMQDQERKKKIKKAYHMMALEYHPDRWDEASSELSYEEQTAKFKTIVHAYKMLTDASYRDGFKDKGRQTSLHAVLSIDLSFEQAFFGMNTTITFNAQHLDEKGNTKKIDKDADEVIFDVDVIKIVVPKDTHHGDRLSYPGRGMKQGEERGDLILVLNVHPHPRLEYDFHTKTFSYKKDIELEEMLKGSSVEVETMFGLETVRVPAGSKPGSVLKKKNIGPDKSYNIEVIIDVKYPDKEDLKENSFWDKLDIDWNKEDKLDEEIREAEEEYEKTFEKLGGWTDPSSGTQGGFWFKP